MNQTVHKAEIFFFSFPSSFNPYLLFKRAKQYCGRQMPTRYMVNLEIFSPDQLNDINITLVKLLLAEGQV